MNTVETNTPQYPDFGALLESVKENGRLMMPLTVRLNHAVADGYLVANVYRLLDKEIDKFCISPQA